MNGRKLLLTGASGFLGSALSKELHDAGFKVTGISRRSIESVDAINWLQGDITHSEDIARALEGCEIVVNAAGKTGIPQKIELRQDFFQVNRDAVAALAKAARQAGVKKFIHVSSTGVYGPGVGRFTEESRCNPINVYEESKFAGESAVLAEAANTMNVIIVRPSNVFGEKHPWNKLLTWLRSVKQGRAVLIGSPEKYWVNYVYVGDVVKAITELTIGGSSSEFERSSSIYIVNTPVTMKEFFEASTYALDAPSKALAVPRWLLVPPAMLLDTISFTTKLQFPLAMDKVKELSNQQIFVADKLKSMLPRFPYFGLREGLLRTCLHYRERGLL